MQSGSCSAPMISVPPFGTATEFSPPPSAVVVLLSSDQAETASRTNANSTVKSWTPQRFRLTEHCLLVWGATPLSHGLDVERPTRTYEHGHGRAVGQYPFRREPVEGLSRPAPVAKKAQHNR